MHKSDKHTMPQYNSMHAKIMLIIIIVQQYEEHTYCKPTRLLANYSSLLLPAIFMLKIAFIIFSLNIIMDILLHLLAQK